MWYGGRRNAEVELGYASLILGIIGLSLSWIPQVGWLGVALGLAAHGFGLRASFRPGSSISLHLLGISGTVIAYLAVATGLAWQIQHAAGAADALLVEVPLPLFYYVAGGLALVVAVGFAVGRLRAGVPGAVIAALGFLGVSVVSAWLLTLEDRRLREGTGQPPTVAAQPENLSPR